MKNKVLNILTIVLLAAIVVVASVFIRRDTGYHNEMKHRIKEAEDQVNKYETRDAKIPFDLEAIQEWESDPNLGKIRMVRASVASINGESATLEDKAGDQWVVNGLDLTTDDNVLLWIADNTTKDKTEDDVVTKVFVEAHTIN